MPVLHPPVPLALAQSERAVPDGPGWWFEPKYDGWRGCLHVARGKLHSRSGADLSCRFPEILRAAEQQVGDLVLDGELVALQAGRLDFAALQSAPGRRATEGITIHFMAFDLLAEEDRDLRKQPYQARRELLEQALATVRAPLALTPATADRERALRWLDADFATVGIEGVVAKHADSRYLGDRREWIKVRHQERVDAVVIGVTGTVGHPDSLVLAQSDGHGHLRAVGLSLPLSRTMRANLAGRLIPVAGAERTALPGPVGGLPGQPAAMYLPVHPKVVVEVEADPNVEFGRFRHRPKVLRVRALSAVSGATLPAIHSRSVSVAVATSCHTQSAIEAAHGTSRVVVLTPTWQGGEPSRRRGDLGNHGRVEPHFCGFAT
ncbi:RNA ligase family protein [Saccharothrix sp.]|uniref:ATP-dependent DNA ligase n=1 Tax=Saccharothrix sp. TaxID=1873460 RepID=UPI002811AC16|nr:RNA ligase family protein [Saccharothrix sp.]